MLSKICLVPIKHNLIGGAASFLNLGDKNCRQQKNKKDTKDHNTCRIHNQNFSFVN